VALKDEFTIDFDVTLVQIPAMFAGRRGLMSERIADDQWRYVLDNTAYHVSKGK